MGIGYERVAGLSIAPPHGSLQFTAREASEQNPQIGVVLAYDVCKLHPVSVRIRYTDT